jgi:tRNA threonylcarbamoyladenosine biosynthesis protein TsaB
VAQEPLILAIDTSGRSGSVAIAASSKLLAQAAFSQPMRHSAEIFPAIRRLLKQLGTSPKDIEHVYISAGPGSFTGLRIAVTIAKIMYLANTAKIVAVDTLDVIAANANDCQVDQANDTKPDNIATVLDAKRGQFFIAAYERLDGTDSTGRQQKHSHAALWQKTLPDSLMTASQFLAMFGGKEKPVWLLGEGLLYYRDKFQANGIRFLHERYWNPQAAKVHLLGFEKALAKQFADPLTLQPIYLRAPDVKVKQ